MPISISELPASSGIGVGVSRESRDGGKNQEKDESSLREKASILISEISAGIGVSSESGYGGRNQEQISLRVKTSSLISELSASIGVGGQNQEQYGLSPGEKSSTLITELPAGISGSPGSGDGICGGHKDGSQDQELSTREEKRTLGLQVSKLYEFVPPILTDLGKESPRKLHAPL